MAGHVSKRHRAECARRNDRGKRCNCDGPWRARYPKPNAATPTDQIERRFRTEREALDWIASQRTSILQGTHIDPREGERRFCDVYEAWRETRWAGLEPKTTARYGQIWRTYLAPEFGGRKVNSISRELVRRYFARLVSEGRAPGTIRKVHAVMSAIMAEAVELGYLRGNPCAGVKGLPRATNREMLFLTADEVRTLAEAIDPHYRTYVYTAAFTGLRSSELCGLRWRNVDLLHGKLTVAEALKEEGGKLLFGPPKSRERRTISLPRFLVEMLMEHAASLTSGSGADDLVFTGPQGGPIRHHLFYRRHFRPTVAGRPARNGKPAVPGALPERLRGLRFHDLRHTCASMLIAEGAHPKLIQTRLGHSSITITLDTYSHVFPSLEESLAEKLDSAFESATPSSNVVTLAAGEGLA